MDELTYGDTFIRQWDVGQDSKGRELSVRQTSVGYRFSHVCTLARSGMIMRIAPLLQIGSGHEIISTDPLHIEASILCDDCGVHGWVRDGRWVPA